MVVSRGRTGLIGDFAEGKVWSARVWSPHSFQGENEALLLRTCLSRNPSSLPAVCGRNMQGKRKTALPRGRKKWPREMSLSVLKTVGNSSSVSIMILTSADEVF